MDLNYQYKMALLALITSVVNLMTVQVLYN